jgi:DNA-directed RNA polymerase I, II, and III subunit RPABC2
MPKKTKYIVESDNNESDEDSDNGEKVNDTEIYDDEEDNEDEIDNEIEDDDEIEDTLNKEDENNLSDEEILIDNDVDLDFVLMETSDNNIVSKENRISCNRLTRYEMVRILGERTKQLSMGAKPLIKNYSGLSYDKIAEEELKLSMIPFKIKRPLPNGFFEIWTLDELKYKHLLSILE